MNSPTDLPSLLALLVTTGGAAGANFIVSRLLERLDRFQRQDKGVKQGIVLFLAVVLGAGALYLQSALTAHDVAQLNPYVSMIIVAFGYVTSQVTHAEDKKAGLKRRIQREEEIQKRAAELAGHREMIAPIDRLPPGALHAYEQGVPVQLTTKSPRQFNRRIVTKKGTKPGAKS